MLLGRAIVPAASKKIELLTMLVFKLKNASADTTIVPEPQPINTLNAYRVIPG